MVSDAVGPLREALALLDRARAKVDEAERMTYTAPVSETSVCDRVWHAIYRAQGEARDSIQELST